METGIRISKKSFKGMSDDQVRASMKNVAEQLRASHRIALQTGGTVEGYTASELAAMAAKFEMVLTW